MSKSILITGASEGGIGHALALEFQKRGLTVFATARSLSKMSSLQAIPNIHLLKLDVTSAADIEAAVKEVRDTTGGKLDYLLNNSGQQYFGPVLDADIATAKKMFDVNFWSILSMTQAFIPLLIPAKGTVINIGSTAGIVGPTFMALYSASKAAVHSLDAIMQTELAPLGVGVLTVVTGSVKTSILANGVPYHMSDESLYQPLKKELEDRALGVGYEGFAKMPPEQFAREVATDVLRGATGKVWRGSYAGITRTVLSRLPESFTAKMYLSGLDMDKLKPGLVA